MSGQNRSSAVMMQRTEPEDSLDDFPTQPWATRALLEALDRFAAQTGRSPIGGPTSVCWEPAANRGFMARPLGERFAAVACSDIHDYGVGYPVRNFLGPRESGDLSYDWIVSNPPFNKAVPFILTALELAQVGCAFLVRAGFLETLGRYDALFRDRRPSLHLHYAERLPLVKGRVDPKASTATAYEWVVWFARPREELFRTCIEDWIAPCRARLERPGDYEIPAGAAWGAGMKQGEMVL